MMKQGSEAKQDQGAVDDHPLANLTTTQIRQKARDMLKVNERLVEQISKLKSMNSQLQQEIYDKAADLQFQESHNNEQLKEVGQANEAWIKSIQEIHSSEMTKKNSELRDIASTRQSDKKGSNLVSTFYVIDQYLTRNTCSTSDLLLILLSVI